MNDNDNKSHRLRNIIMIIIIIIIILLLITCCTSSAFGRIGSMFNNESHINIDEDDGDKETILNGDLKFDGDLLKLYLSDKIGHLSFSYKNINPQKFTCYIKDASIATCYVKNGYVVVMPKKVGKSVLVLETLTNGKKYQATSSLEIDSANKYIKLERNNGTIDLYGSKTLYVPYTLVRLTGDVFVKVDNDDVISATLKDGVIRITGKKKGRAKVTITVKDHDKTYTETFEVTVTDSTPSKSHSTKDSDATLKNLSSKNGKIDFHKEQNKYDITVPNSTSKFSLEATPSSSKAKVTYEFNGEIVDSLEDLELKEGKNKLKVTVTAEDGSTNTYEVTIERESKTSSGNTPSNPNLSDDNYLSNYHHLN